jgi:hypothetical protein
MTRATGVARAKQNFLRKEKNKYFLQSSELCSRFCCLALCKSRTKR